MYREELFTQQAALNSTQLRLREYELMNDRLIAGLAEVAMSSTSSSTVPAAATAAVSCDDDNENDDSVKATETATARALVTSALLRGCKTRTTLLHEANTLTQINYQKEALYRNNQVLSHQVLVLLNQVNLFNSGAAATTSTTSTAGSGSREAEDEWNMSYQTSQQLHQAGVLM